MQTPGISFPRFTAPNSSDSKQTYQQKAGLPVRILKLQTLRHDACLEWYLKIAYRFPSGVPHTREALEEINSMDRDDTALSWACCVLMKFDARMVYYDKQESLRIERSVGKLSEEVFAAKMFDLRAEYLLNADNFHPGFLVPAEYVLRLETLRHLEPCEPQFRLVARLYPHGVPLRDSAFTLLKAHNVNLMWALYSVLKHEAIKQHQREYSAECLEYTNEFNTNIGTLPSERRKLHNAHYRKLTEIQMRLLLNPENWKSGLLDVVATDTMPEVSGSVCDL